MPIPRPLPRRLLACAVLLAGLVGQQPALAALPERVAPACVLEPRAAGDVGAALEYGGDLWRSRSGVVVGGIRVERAALRFLEAGSGTLRLVALHRRNAPHDGPPPGWQGRTLAVYVDDAAPGPWSEAAREVGERLDGLRWRCEARGPQALPPLASGLAWAWLALAALLVLRAARAQGGSPSRPEIAALLLLLALSLAVRVPRWSPFPLHYIEMERVPPAPKPGAEVAAALAAPLLSLTGDGVAAQAALNVGLGALAPLLLVALGARWRSRATGWIAGLLLALAPLQARFGGSSDAAVTLVPVLLAAVLATDLALAEPRRGAALGAGLLWGLALALRPDGPIYLLALAAWLGRDRRGRVLLRSPARLAGLVAPLMLGGALAGRAVVERGALTAPLFELPTLGAMAEALAAATWDLGLDPRLRPWPETLLALGGALLVLRGPARAFSLLAGLALPGLAFALQGGRPFADSPLSLEEAKAALYGHPYWLLAAAALLTAPLDLPPPWRRRLLPASALGLLGLLAADASYAGRVTRPSPVQAEHAFLAEELPRLPARAVLLVLGAADGTNGPVHVEHRARQAGRAVLRGVDDLADTEGLVVLGEGAATGAIPATVPVYGVRGWLAFAGPRGGRDVPPGADNCRRVSTTPHPRTGETTLPLCLLPIDKRRPRLPE